MKTIKILAALLTAVTMTVGSVGVTAYAADKEKAAAEETAEKQYDIDNAAYRERVDEMIRDPYEKEIIEYFKAPIDGRSYYGDLVHFYQLKDGQGTYAEYKTGKRSRKFHDLSINFDKCYISSDDKLSDAEEIISKVNAFLKESSFKAEFKKSDNEDCFTVVFDESYTDGDKANAWTALKKEYGISCDERQTTMGYHTYTDGMDLEDDEYSYLFGSMDYDDNKYLERGSYDINNKAYRRFSALHLSGYKLLDDPRLLRAVNATNSLNNKIVKIYNEIGLYALEYEMPDGSRMIEEGISIHPTNSFKCLKENGKMYTMKELEAFAKKYNYDIKFEIYRDNGKKISGEMMEEDPEKALYRVEYSEKYSLAEQIEISVMMDKELGIKYWGLPGYICSGDLLFKDGVDYAYFYNGMRIYTDGSSHGETEEITFDREEEKDPKDIPTLPSVLGDADMSGSVDLADLTTAAKYNLNHESYPIDDNTAYANADMNFDGVVDGLDISVMIEKQLGKKLY